jgi:hypothetical protein
VRLSTPFVDWTMNTVRVLYDVASSSNLTLNKSKHVIGSHAFRLHQRETLTQRGDG